METTIFNLLYLISFIVSIIVVAISALFIFCQLKKSDKANRIAEINSIIQLENLITDRNTALLEAIQENERILKLDDPNPDQMRNVEHRVDVLKTALLNTVERLCFLIKDDNKIIVEYRDLITSIVRNYEKEYGEGSNFTNTKLVNSVLKKS
ncbi:hypothetical protein [Aggregatibacter segnis]|uniref:hypothetical protein n=1 Tax=Aggregatibacter segnis TaxID=739 RepID=UPI002889A226|nr:hypothetical protein [Aggregatibacter segnis]